MIDLAMAEMLAINFQTDAFVSGRKK